MVSWYQIVLLEVEAELTQLREKGILLNYYYPSAVSVADADGGDREGHQSQGKLAVSSA